MMYTSDDFKSAAAKAFQCLKCTFQQSGSYWQTGHAFDTIIDYFVTNPDPANNPSDVAKIALENYCRNKKEKACWYDDYGWWGIAALKASRYFDTEATKDLCVEFKKITQECWDTMHNNAPNVWEKADKSKYAYMKPRFPGGVWNFYPTDSDGPPAPSACGNNVPCAPLKASDPKCTGHNTLCVIQNTVTNGLYLVLAARLAQANPTDAVYPDAANCEYGFLHQWFSLDDSNLESLLAKAALPGNLDVALVRERVSTFGVADNEGQYSRICGYNPEQAWAGDQGLILGGLVDLIKMPGNTANTEELFELAKQIADGVLAAAKLCHQNLLTAWITGKDFDPGDYNTGIGVYMRYLLYAYTNNNNLKAYLQKADYPDFVRANAEHVIAHPSSYLDMVGLTNDLAILLAAIAMPD